MREEIKQRIDQIKNGKVPEGYTYKYHFKPNSWKDEPLNMFFYKANDKNHEKKYSTVFTNSAANGVIPQNEYFEKDIANEENIDGYYIVNAGDYIYNPRISEKAPYGPINQNQTGYTGIASPLYTVFAKKENTCVCDEYIQYYLSSTEWNKYIYSVANYGARFDRMNISDSDFMNMPVALPQIEEQQKIAEILMQCDKVIELKQKQIDETKKLKKVFLSKMFPKNGENVPEIRFSGFTDPWEQRKLSSLCEKFTDGDWIESKDQSDSGVRLVQTGNVGIAEYLNKPNNKKWISADTFDRLHCEEVLPGDILISRLPEPAGRACIMPFLGTKMITAVDCTIVRTAPDVSNKFLVQYLSSQAYFDEVNTCLAGGTRQRISRSNLAEFDVPIPSKKVEQDAIGTFFGNLDNLITLHQRELQEWQNKKKALMQLLLTGIVRVKI